MLVHGGLEGNVGQKTRRGCIEGNLNLCLRHHGCTARDLLHASGKIEGLRHFRSSDQIENFGPGLNDVCSLATRIGDRIMHTAILRHVLAQEVDTDIHQLDRIERRSPEMGGVRRMSGNTLEAIVIFEDGKVIG